MWQFFTGAIFVLLLLEFASTIYYLVKDRRYVSVSNKLATESNIFIDTVAGKKKAYADTMFPHPYLGFVHRPHLKVENMQRVNSTGHFGREFPLEKEDGTFVILVTGGSVAAQYVGMDGSIGCLEEELNKYYTGEKIRKFVILNGGDGAWAQPQQHILFSLHSGIIDGVITLDGFNEHYSVYNNKRFEYPSSNFLLCINQDIYNWRTMFYLYLDRQLYRFQKNLFLLRHSKLAHFIISAIREQVKRCGGSRKQVSTDYGDYAVLEEMFRLPDDWNEKKIHMWQLEQYRRYIRMMQAISAAMGIKTLFCIQPCPAIDKDLTPEERNIVGELSYKKNYIRMRNSLLELKKENIPICDLTDIFKDYKGTVYTDKIHINQKGYERINNRILAMIETQWGFKRQMNVKYAV